MDHFRVDPGCLAVRRRDIAFDAGGFGKGEALDRARTLALARHIEHWMVNLGGQVMVSGRPPDGSVWRVSVAHPSDRDVPAVSVVLTEGSLATSGGERDVYTGRRRLGHIIDPRTGHPVSRAGSVTVWHSRGLVADVLSTALYVMGVEEGLSWAERNQVAACFLIPEGKRLEIRVTPRFQELLSP